MTSKKHGWKFWCDWRDCEAEIAMTMTKAEAMEVLQDSGWTAVVEKDQHRCPKHAHKKSR